MQEERRSLIEYLYSGKLNGELFFDEFRKMNYHVDEVYGDVLNLGSTLVLALYENKKSRFLYLPDHLNDLEVILTAVAQQAA